MKTVSIKEQGNLKKDTPSPYETLDLSISEDGIVHLMGTLTNLYSRPAEAVFREYVSNGLDSHIKSKQKKPVEVIISQTGFTTIDGIRHDNVAYLKIRDHGVGMTKEDIVNVYSRYASSTKRDSNEQIGAFGLGAKSALAISDRFDVSSVKDGVEVNFFIKMDNRGIGVVHFVSEKATKRTNGVTVWVPLKKDKDYKTMLELATKDDFFKTWKRGTVTFNNEEPSIKKSVYNTEKYLPLFLGEHELAWVSYLSNNEPYAYDYNRLAGSSLSIAGIGYPIDTSNGNSSNSGINKLNESVSGQFIKRLRDSRISVVLNLPIGSVDLTPSRESIMITEKTLTTLQSSYDLLYKEIPFAFSSHMNTLNRKDAWNFYANNLVAFGIEDDKKSKFQWNPTIKDTFGIKYKGQLVPNRINAAGISTIASVNASTYEDKWQNPLHVDLFSLGFGSPYQNENRYSFNLRGRTSRYSQILVYGTKGGDLDSDLAIVKRNARSYALANGALNKYVNIFYSRNAPITDPWLLAISPPVSISELERISKEYRSEQAKIAAAGRTAKAKRPKAIHFGTMLDSQGEVISKRFTVDEVKDAKKVLFVVQEEWNGWYGARDYANMSNFWATAGSDLTEEPLAFSPRDKNGMYQVLARAFPETLVIMVPSSRSINPLIKIAPEAPTLTKYINDELTKISKDKAKLQILKNIVEIDEDFAGGNPIVDTLGKSGVLDFVENSVTQATFKEFYNHGDIYNIVRMSNLFIETNSYKRGNKVDNANVLTEKILYSHRNSSQATFWNRYNMLKVPAEAEIDKKLGTMLCSLINTVDSMPL